MAITYQTEGVAMPVIRRRNVSGWVKQIAAGYGFKTGDVAFVFCSDSIILEINSRYLKHDYYTDVITFDYSDDSIIAGDIFISIDTVRSNSEQYKTGYEEELHRTMIHGILHLCGLKDKTPAARKTMQEAENKALAILNTKS